MTTIIKGFSDTSVLYFGKGRFDEYCVFMHLPSGGVHIPKDVEYFKRIENMCKAMPRKEVYADFVRVYERTRKQLNQSILRMITKISAKYGEHGLRMEKLLTILYATMIAEENKKHAPLGKRIKRLGMHQLIMENMPAAQAATFSFNKKADFLNQLCQERGF